MNIHVLTGKAVALLAFFACANVSARAEVPSEAALKATLPGTWYTEVNQGAVKIIGTMSYSPDGTVEYRMRQVGIDADVARWSSRYPGRKLHC
jgi:hypothetical protein